MPWTNPPAPRAEPKVKPRILWLAILALGLCWTLAGIAISIEQDRLGAVKGQAVVRAYQRAGLDDGAGVEDEGLADDEAVAGAMWARAHPSAKPVSCPSNTPAFERGCRDQARQTDHRSGR